MQRNNKIPLILGFFVFIGVLHNNTQAKGGWGAFAGGAITGAALSGAFSRPSEVYYVEQPPQRPRYSYDDYEYNHRLRANNQRLRDDQQRLMEENRQLREEAKRRDQNYAIAQENKNLENEQRKYRQSE